jgi:GDPmannose 4,6-dehydratase
MAPTLRANCLSRGYRVIGTSRDAQMSSFPQPGSPGHPGPGQLVSMASNDFRSVLQVLSRHEPHEVYNLAGQSSVGLSFEQPGGNAGKHQHRHAQPAGGHPLPRPPIRYYSAGSGECFGDTGMPQQ